MYLNVHRKKLETIETAMYINFTSGEGLDIVPVSYKFDFKRHGPQVIPTNVGILSSGSPFSLTPISKGGYPDTRSVFF
jgi:hypothetical protein